MLKKNWLLMTGLRGVRSQIALQSLADEGETLPFSHKEEIVHLYYKFARMEMRPERS